MRYQNPDKFQFKFSAILCLRQRLLSAPRKPDALIIFSKWPRYWNAEYNRRAAIIEGLRTERSATEIIRFFGYLRSTVYDIVIKYTLEQSNEIQYASEEESLERTHRENPRSCWKGSRLISDDPGQSLWKLASIVGVSESTIRWIAEEDLRYNSYTLKIR